MDSGYERRKARGKARRKARRRAQNISTEWIQTQTVTQGERENQTSVGIKTIDAQNISFPKAQQSRILSNDEHDVSQKAPPQIISSESIQLKAVTPGKGGHRISTSGNTIDVPHEYLPKTREAQFLPREESAMKQKARPRKISTKMIQTKTVTGGTKGHKMSIGGNTTDVQNTSLPKAQFLSQGEPAMIQKPHHRNISTDFIETKTMTQGVKVQETPIGSKRIDAETASLPTAKQPPVASRNDPAMNQKTRPRLRKDIADEIRETFLAWNSKKLRERKKLIFQVVQRRERKRSGQNRRQDKEFVKDNLSGQTRGQDKKPAQHNSCEELSPNKKVLGPNSNDPSRTQKRILDILNEPRPRPKVDTSGSDAALAMETRSSPKTVATNQNMQPNDQLLKAYHACKEECTRLDLENKTLRIKLNAMDAETSLLHQKVDDLTSETTNVREQLTKWQKKSKRLSELQSKEKIKFDNSTDIVADARVGLTKALNNTSKLEAKIYDLETTIDERDRRVDNLYETIDRQTQTIGELSIKLRDKETVLRLNENEKRKLEEEVEVLIVSKGNGDMAETLRRLKREREKWLWEREQNIEAARIKLEIEKERMLEGEKLRHRQEIEILIEDSDKKREVEEKQQKMQQFVNQELDEMLAVNRELQERLTWEREELNFAIREQDEMISALESQLNGANREIAARNQSEKEHVFWKAEVEAVKEDLREAQNSNKSLQDIINQFLVHDAASFAEDVDWLQKTPKTSRNTLRTEEYEESIESEKKKRPKNKGGTSEKKKYAKKHHKKRRDKKKKKKLKIKTEMKKKKKRQKSSGISTLNHPFDVSSIAVFKNVHRRKTKTEELLLSNSEQIFSTVPHSIFLLRDSDM